MRRAKLVVGVVAVMMAMLLAIAAPAMADHNRHDNNNNNHHNNHHNGWNNNDRYDDFFDDFYDDFDFYEEELFFFTPFFFAIEDIDCDGFDDDLDGLIDEDAVVCVVELD